MTICVCIFFKKVWFVRLAWSGSWKQMLSRGDTVKYVRFYAMQRCFVSIITWLISNQSVCFDNISMNAKNTSLYHHHDNQIKRKKHFHCLNSETILFSLLSNNKNTPNKPYSAVWTSWVEHVNSAARGSAPPTLLDTRVDLTLFRHNTT